MKKIMLLARDPGGANTILALVPALQNQGYELLLCGKDAALHRYRHFGLEGKDVGLERPVIDCEHWLEFLELEQPDLIITGTSGDDFSERYLWQAARRKGIGSLAILDQWINYGLRFSSYGLDRKDEYEKNHLHPYLPDFILVMDEEARLAMIRDGIEAERIIVSGQPYFDLLLQQQKHDNRRLIRETRQGLQIAPNDYVIAFVSESISQDYRVSPGESPYWGYDEISILKELLQVLVPISREETRPVHLLIKKHPLERSDNYLKLLNDSDCSKLRYQVAEGNIDPWSLVLASDLVCGMSSMLLLESILLGRPTLSIQIGLKRDNPLILDKRGVLLSILDRKDLLDNLRDIIQRNKIPRYNWKVEAGAIDKVIQLVEGCLCRN